MPFSSEKQRRFMWAKHPEIAEKWAEEGKGHVEKKKKGKRRSRAVEALRKAHK